MARTAAGTRQLVQGLGFNGTTTYVNFGTMGNFGSNLGSGFYAKFQIQTLDKTSTKEIFGVFATGGVNPGLELFYNSVSSTGDLQFYFKDPSGNAINAHWDGANSPHINDGAIHTIELTVVANPAAATLKIDGVTKTVGYYSQQNLSGFANFNTFFAIGGQNFAGTMFKFTSGIIYNLQVGTSAGALYGSYNLQEGTGTTANDTSGQGNNGTLSGSPLPVWNTRTAATNRFLDVGTSETSLSFNGTSDFATVPVTPSTSGFSVGFWLKVNKYASNACPISWLDSFTNGFRLFSDSNTTSRMNIQIQNGGATGQNVFLSTIEKPQWWHFTYTFDGTINKFYINAVSAGQVSRTIGNNISTGLTIGKLSGGTGFLNCIEKNLTFQNTATPWTLAQIQDLMYRNIIPSGAQQWSMNNTLNDTTGANPLTATGTSYSSDVPSQFNARTLVS